MDSSEDGECASNVEDANTNACPIRKRRFSNARIQPTRVKKVMQSDEDIGRMVASVPVAIGSAMEHFAEKLLEAASACVPNTTSRTLSPMHIKYAVMRNPQFAFLEPLVRDIKLPKNTDGVLMQAPPSSTIIESPISANTSASSPYTQIFQFPTANDNGGPSTSTAVSGPASSLASALTNPTTPVSAAFLHMVGTHPAAAHLTPLVASTSSMGSRLVFPTSNLEHPPQNIPQLTDIASAVDATQSGEPLKRKRGRPPRVDRPNVGSDFPSPTVPITDIIFTAQPPATRHNGTAEAPPIAKRVSHIGGTPGVLSTDLSTIFEHDATKVPEPLE